MKTTNAAGQPVLTGFLILKFRGASGKMITRVVRAPKTEPQPLTEGRHAGRRVVTISAVGTFTSEVLILDWDKVEKIPAVLNLHYGEYEPAE